MISFLPPFLMAFSICLLLIPATIRLAWRWRLVDDPRRGHPAILHQGILPRAGGIPIFAGFALTSLLFAQLDLKLSGILIGGLLNVVVGTLDDKYSLAPFFRLLTLTASALLALTSGIRLPGDVVTNPLGGSLHLGQFWGSVFLVVWIVGMANLVNWSKGVGQMPGVAVIASLVLAAVALRYQAGNPYQHQTALLSFILAGTTLAFLPFNFPPEKILPGFGASTLIGFNLAVLAVLSGGKLAATILVLALPTVDALLTLLRRILSRRPVTIGDRGHLYHKLLDLGLTKRQIVLLYWFFTGLLGLLAVNLTTARLKIFAIGMLAAAISLVFLTASLVLSKERGPA